MHTSSLAALQSVPAPRWVISDTHLGHANILQYCPWRQQWARTIAEHDAAIISAWQAVVGPDDWVLHLGDLALGERQRLPMLRRALPGRIALIRGNHDRSALAMRSAGFDLVLPAAVVEIGADRWYCRHDPAAFTDAEAQAATRLLHGHCHGNGYCDKVPAEVRALARDCSLDALRVVGPVPWAQVA